MKNNFLIMGFTVMSIMILAVSCKENKTPKPPMEKVENTINVTRNDFTISVSRMVRAMNEYNVPAIEMLRDSVTRAHIDAILPMWDIELDWKTKDGFTFLMCDQNDPRLKPMMEEALNSPLEDSNAYGLCYLQGKDCNFNSLLDPKGQFSKEAINQQIKALKN